MSEQAKFNVSKDQLQKFIERVERLEEEKSNLMEDIRDVYKEAKYQGFDTSIMRKMIKLRKMDNTKLQEEDYLIDLYRKTLGI
ncbi:MAG: DUF2312 domain-containing protein [Rickettsiales bacterium]|nr:DUF2312 domain-containing protein [Rickettsiales bacterium]